MFLTIVVISFLLTYALRYFIESITKEMETKIREKMEEIDRLGGMVSAVSSGFVQKEVAGQAYEYEKGLQQGTYTKVGVNKFTEGETREVELHEYDPASAERKIADLRTLKAERNDREVLSCLRELERAAKSRTNVMPFLVDCCKAYVTIGEMTDVFRQVYGEFTEPGIF